MRVVRATDNGGGEIVVPEADLKRLDDDPTLFHIYVTPFRDSAMAFMRILEFKHFTPGLQINDKFIVHHFDMDGMPMCIITMPLEDRAKAEEVARMLMMRLSDGVPFMAGPKGMVPPPMTSIRAVSLAAGENVRSGVQGRPEAKDAEEKLIEGYEREHALWLLKQDKRWMDGKWWYRIRTIKDAPPPDEVGRLLEDVLAGEEAFWYVKRSDLTDEEFKNYKPSISLK